MMRTNLYLSDETINNIDEKQMKIYLSSIFNWFADDFKDTHGTVLGFVKEHLSTEAATKLSTDYAIQYTEYDWNLNDGSN